MAWLTWEKLSRLATSLGWRTVDVLNAQGGTIYHVMKGYFCGVFVSSQGPPHCQSCYFSESFGWASLHKTRPKISCTLLPGRPHKESARLLWATSLWWEGRSSSGSLASICTLQMDAYSCPLGDTELGSDTSHKH